MPHDVRGDDAAYLWDICNSIDDLLKITDGKVYTDLEADRLLQLGVERAIEIIGEAASKVSDETKERYSEIHWSGIIAQRHVIAHEYGGIRYDKLWQIVIEHAPVLLEQLSQITLIPPPDPLPEG